MGGAGPHHPLRQRGVLQERDQGPRGPVGVAEPEVARLRVVLVALLGYQREPEQVAVEGGRPLQVAADQRHVVQPGEPHAALLAHLKPKPPERRLNSSRSPQNAVPNRAAPAARTIACAAPPKNITAMARIAGMPASTVVWDR